jgi:hypothetical protein
MRSERRDCRRLRAATFLLEFLTLITRVSKMRIRSLKRRLLQVEVKLNLGRCKGLGSRYIGVE